jgi:hypothetical protein
MTATFVIVWGVLVILFARLASTSQPRRRATTNADGSVSWTGDSGGGCDSGADAGCDGGGGDWGGGD